MLTFKKTSFTSSEGLGAIRECYHWIIGDVPIQKEGVA